MERLHAIDFYATAYVWVPEGEDPREFVESHWEKCTEDARRYMLDNGEFETYAFDMTREEED